MHCHICRKPATLFHKLCAHCIAAVEEYLEEIYGSDSESLLQDVSDSESETETIECSTPILEREEKAAD